MSEVSVPLRGLSSWKANASQALLSDALSFSPLTGIKFVERQRSNKWQSVVRNVSVPLRGLSSWKGVNFTAVKRKSVESFSPLTGIKFVERV